MYVLLPPLKYTLLHRLHYLNGFRTCYIISIITSDGNYKDGEVSPLYILENLETCSDFAYILKMEREK